MIQDYIFTEQQLKNLSESSKQPFFAYGNNKAGFWRSVKYGFSGHLNAFIDGYKLIVKPSPLKDEYNRPFLMKGHGRVMGHLVLIDWHDLRMMDIENGEPFHRIPVRAILSDWSYCYAWTYLLDKTLFQTSYSRTENWEEIHCWHSDKHKVIK